MALTASNLRKSIPVKMGNASPRLFQHSPLLVPDLLGHAVDAEIVEHAPLAVRVGHDLVRPRRPQLASVLAMIIDSAGIHQHGISVEQPLADIDLLLEPKIKVIGEFLH